MASRSEVSAGVRRRAECEPLWRSFMCALLPNVAFLLAGRFVAIPRGVVNLDYLALAAVAPWMPAPAFVACASLLMALDTIESLAGSYYFSFADALSATGELVHLAPVFAFGVAAGVLAVITVIAFGSHRLVRGSGTPRRTAFLLGLAVLLATVDLVDGTNMFSPSQGTTVRFNLAGSAIVRAAGQLSNWMAELRNPAGTVQVKGATAGLLQGSATVGDENVVLIVEESFGLMLDDEGRELLLAPLRTKEVLDRYEVDEGDVAFHGSTVAGEFRELCGREVGLRARATNSADLAACLPAIFHRAGYHTAALHGFTSRMFERNRWYPRFGFDEQLFEDELRAMGLDECGFAFRGICDSAIATEIGDRLAAHRTRQFIYWLTLNAHLPVDHAVAERSSFQCGAYAPARENPDVCDWMRVTIATHEAIARLVTDPRLPPTRFIIAGDHAPPFLSKSKRGLFSQMRVPTLRLTPRGKAIPQLVSKASSHVQR